MLYFVNGREVSRDLVSFYIGEDNLRRDENELIERHQESLENEYSKTGTVTIYDVDTW